MGIVCNEFGGMYYRLSHKFSTCETEILVCFVGEWCEYQLLGDDGAAQQAIGHRLLANLVQQRGPGYSAPVWSPIKTK
jgi:hypothetical protein